MSTEIEWQYDKEDYRTVAQLVAAIRRGWRWDDVETRMVADLLETLDERIKDLESYSTCASEQIKRLTAGRELPFKPKGEDYV